MNPRAESGVTPLSQRARIGLAPGGAGFGARLVAHRRDSGAGRGRHRARSVVRHRHWCAGGCRVRRSVAGQTRSVGVLAALVGRDRFSRRRACGRSHQGFARHGFFAHVIDGNIADRKLPFACLATDLATGREVWLREGSVSAAVRASSSQPGVFEPVEHDGRDLVDGSLVNPVPVSLARAPGAERMIAVGLGSDPVRQRPAVRRGGQGAESRHGTCRRNAGVAVRRLVATHGAVNIA